MAPEFGDTQVMSPVVPTAASSAEEAAPDEIELPTMEDLDLLVGDLDAIDATLAQLR